MSDEINNKDKIEKIGGLDIKKARAIILDAIGDNKRQKSGNAEKIQTARGFSPLFFKDQKRDQEKKEIQLPESERSKGAREANRVIGENKKSGKDSSPLFSQVDKKKLTGKNGDVNRKKFAAPIIKKILKPSDRNDLARKRRSKGGISDKIKFAPKEKKSYFLRRARLIAGVVAYVFLIGILLFIIFLLFIIKIGATRGN